MDNNQNKKRGVTGRFVGQNYQMNIETGAHNLKADEPRDKGGDDQGPSPYELMSAALIACTAMTLRMYARRKEWDLQDVRVNVWHDKVHAEDCEDCEKSTSKIDRFDREIELVGDLDDKQRARLMDIADKCPVHRTLTSNAKIITRMV